MVRSRQEVPGKWAAYASKSLQQRQNIARNRNRNFVERQRRNQRRTIHPERGMLINEIPNPRLGEIATFQGWREFVTTPDPYDPALVVDFYASMVPAAFNEFSTVLVRGVTVRITIDDICRHYHIPRFPNLDPTFGIPAIPGVTQEEMHSPLIAAALRRSGRPNWVPRDDEIRKVELRPEIAMWLRFIKSSLAPSSHYSEVDWYSARILFCLQEDMNVDAGHIIFLGLIDAAADNCKGILPFPCLITKLCRDAGVQIGPVIPPPAPLDRSAYRTHQTAANKFDAENEEVRFDEDVDNEEAEDDDYNPAADEGVQADYTQLYNRMGRLEQNQRQDRERMNQGFERIDWGLHYLTLLHQGEQVPNDVWPFQPPGGEGPSNPRPAQRGRREQGGGRRRNRGE